MNKGFHNLPQSQSQSHPSSRVKNIVKWQPAHTPSETQLYFGFHTRAPSTWRLWRTAAFRRVYVYKTRLDLLPISTVERNKNVLNYYSANSSLPENQIIQFAFTESIFSHSHPLYVNLCNAANHRTARHGMACAGQLNWNQWSVCHFILKTGK